MHLCFSAAFNMSSTDVDLGQMANPRIYQPLDRKQHQFRLLRLHAGRKPKALICTLYSEHLRRDKGYEALSYVWGDPNATKDIQVNGQSLPVTENLHNALHRLRRPKESRILWIDAICIDQKNDLEKGHQVGLMSRIYTFASGIVIWLGDVSFQDENSATSAFNSFKDTNDRLATASGAPSREGIYRCYERLMSSPWFARSWTVQEAILARKLTVMLGPGFASFDDILSCEDSLWRTLRKAEVKVVPGCYRAIAGMRKQRRHPGGTGLTFLNAIHRYWDHEATDSRDKIYALLGIVNDWQGFNEISADYTIDANRVFARATFEIIRRQRSVEFLSTVVLGSGESDGKPSWIPPFTSATLKRAKERYRSRPTADLHLYDTSVLSMNGKFCQSITSAFLQRHFVDMNMLEFEKIYRDALESATGIPGMVYQYMHSTIYRNNAELMHLRSLLWKRRSLPPPEERWLLEYNWDSSHEVWKEFKSFLTTNRKDGAPAVDQAALTADFNLIIKRWMCWCANETACTTKQSAASEYVGAFGEHMDDFDISLLLRDDKPAVKFKERFVFTTEDGSLGFAPPVAPGDEIWAFEDHGMPFILRPAGSRELLAAQKGDTVQTYKLVGRCLSLFHPDQFDIFEPRPERKQTEIPSRRIYLV